MLKININSFKYENKEILNNVSVNFQRGKAYCIVGKNGSGKTTFLNIISSLIPSVIDGNLDGTIKFKDRVINFDDIDYVFQNSENSLFYNRVMDQLKNIDSDRLNYWLKQFNLLEYKNKYVRELSVGQKKIISCLMALLSDRTICILDEPSANLDVKNKEALIELIKKRKKDKIIIIVSHDSEIVNVCDFIYKINDEKTLIVEQKTNYPVPVSSNELLLSKKNKYKEAEEIFTLNGFKYVFENNEIFEYNKKITISTNSIVAILGKNGSGKTTFANYIIENYDKFYKNGITTHKITCSIMFQTFYKQLFEFSIKDELLFGVKKQKKLFDEKSILREIGLYDKRYEDPRFISDGQKRILIVASLLMSKKDLIILDEPFDNIDNNSKEILKKMLLAYKDAGGSIVILDQTADDFCEIADDYIMF